MEVIAIRRCCYLSVLSVLCWSPHLANSFNVQVHNVDKISPSFSYLETLNNVKVSEEAASVLGGPTRSDQKSDDWIRPQNTYPPSTYCPPGSSTPSDDDLSATIQNGRDASQPPPDNVKKTDFFDSFNRFGPRKEAWSPRPIDSSATTATLQKSHVNGYTPSEGSVVKGYDWTSEMKATPSHEQESLSSSRRSSGTLSYLENLGSTTGLEDVDSGMSVEHTNGRMDDKASRHPQHQSWGGKEQQPAWTTTNLEHTNGFVVSNGGIHSKNDNGQSVTMTNTLDTNGHLMERASVEKPTHGERQDMHHTTTSSAQHDNISGNVLSSTKPYLESLGGGKALRDTASYLSLATVHGLVKGEPLSKIIGQIADHNAPWADSYDGGYLGEDVEPINGDHFGDDGQPINGGYLRDDGQPINGGYLRDGDQPINGGHIGEEDEPINGGHIGEEDEPINGGYFGVTTPVNDNHPTITTSETFVTPDVSSDENSRNYVEEFVPQIGTTLTHSAVETHSMGYENPIYNNIIEANGKEENDQTSPQPVAQTSGASVSGSSRSGFAPFASHANSHKKWNGSRASTGVTYLDRLNCKNTLGEADSKSEEASCDILPTEGSSTTTDSISNLDSAETSNPVTTLSTFHGPINSCEVRTSNTHQFLDQSLNAPVQSYSAMKTNGSTFKANGRKPNGYRVSSALSYLDSLNGASASDVSRSKNENENDPTQVPMSSKDDVPEDTMESAFGAKTESGEANRCDKTTLESSTSDHGTAFSSSHNGSEASETQRSSGGIDDGLSVSNDSTAYPDSAVVVESDVALGATNSADDIPSSLDQSENHDRFVVGIADKASPSDVKSTSPKSRRVASHAFGTSSKTKEKRQASPSYQNTKKSSFFDIFNFFQTSNVKRHESDADNQHTENATIFDEQSKVEHECTDPHGIETESAIDESEAKLSAKDISASATSSDSQMKENRMSPALSYLESLRGKSARNSADPIVDHVSSTEDDAAADQTWQKADYHSNQGASETSAYDSSGKGRIMGSATTRGKNGDSALTSGLEFLVSNGYSTNNALSQNHNGVEKTSNFAPESDLYLSPILENGNHNDWESDRQVLSAAAATKVDHANDADSEINQSPQAEISDQEHYTQDDGIPKILTFERDTLAPNLSTWDTLKSSPNRERNLNNDVSFKANGSSVNGLHATTPQPSTPDHGAGYVWDSSMFNGNPTGRNGKEAVSSSPEVDASMNSIRATNDVWETGFSDFATSSTNNGVHGFEGASTAAKMSAFHNAGDSSNYLFEGKADHPYDFTLADHSSERHGNSDRVFRTFSPQDNLSPSNLIDQSEVDAQVCGGPQDTSIFSSDGRRHDRSSETSAIDDNLPSVQESIAKSRGSSFLTNSAMLGNVDINDPPHAQTPLPSLEREGSAGLRFSERVSFRTLGFPLAVVDSSTTLQATADQEGDRSRARAPAPDEFALTKWNRTPEPPTDSSLDRRMLGNVRAKQRRSNQSQVRSPSAKSSMGRMMRKPRHSSLHIKKANVLDLVHLLHAQAETQKALEARLNALERSQTSALDRASQHVNPASEIVENSFPVIVQGGSRETWAFPSPSVNRVQVVLTTEGRPMNADVQLWQGPNNIPQKLRVYVENGSLCKFTTLIETPRGSNTIAIRNAGQLEFPLGAYVVDEVGQDSTMLPTISDDTVPNVKARNSDAAADQSDASEHLNLPDSLDEFDVRRRVQGGAVRTFPFDRSVNSVEVLLKTDGRPLNARVELLQGPNNNKQVFDVYTEDGRVRPFFAVIETPGRGTVVRVVNTGTSEYPLTAWVEPYAIDSEVSAFEPEIGGDSSDGMEWSRRQQG